MLTTALFTACLVTVQSVNANPKEENVIENRSSTVPMTPPPSEVASSMPPRKWVKLARLNGGKENYPSWQKSALEFPEKYKLGKKHIYVRVD